MRLIDWIAIGGISVVFLVPAVLGVYQSLSGQRPFSATLWIVLLVGLVSGVLVIATGFQGGSNSS